MSQKTVLIVGGVLLVGGAAAYFLLKNKNKLPVQNTAQSDSTSQTNNTTQQANTNSQPTSNPVNSVDLSKFATSSELDAVAKSVPKFYFGSYGPFDPNGNDSAHTIYIPDQGTTNYQVQGVLVGEDFNRDNDLGFIILNKTKSSFTLSVREYSSQKQSVKFEFMVVRP